jgi:ComF family protein
MERVTAVTALIPNPKSLIPDTRRFVRNAANALMSATMAPACAVCKDLLEEPLSGCVCGTCWASIRPITPPVCDACGDPLARQHQSPIPHSQLICATCIRHRSAIDRARAIGEYDGTLREIIHALKYDGRRSLARPLAALMCARGADLLKDADCVVPVPLHWRREHSRGFNQARELSRYIGLPVVEALVRTRYTRPQIELAADRRRTNVAGAFRRRLGGFRQPIRAKKVVLVDDVSTTGATLEACARTLKEDGASDVYTLTAARVVTRRRGDFASSTGPGTPVVLYASNRPTHAYADDGDY